MHNFQKECGSIVIDKVQAHYQSLPQLEYIEVRTPKLMEAIDSFANAINDSWPFESNSVTIKTVFSIDEGTPKAQCFEVKFFLLKKLKFYIFPEVHCFILSINPVLPELGKIVAQGY